MIILISGASHTGKTVLAQKLLEKYKVPVLSLDLLKMGLIRSSYTTLTPEEDEQLTAYLWPIVREMIKTAIENGQHLIIEGGYIPFHWREDFSQRYLKEIQFYCLIMTEKYIKNHFKDIQKYANVLEKRLDDEYFTPEQAIAENLKNLELCERYHCAYFLIDNVYEINLEQIQF